MEESLLADPAASLDQLAVHDRDLSRRAAERDEAELHPEAQRLSEADVPPGETGVTYVWPSCPACRPDRLCARDHLVTPLPLSASGIRKARRRSRRPAARASGR